ncbi:MAG TPA: GatB/YqeY domain-containing protein [Caldilineaceae bacterium]|nr:GatB/YqeY domain-containing protein [Caldilineaceae bacterium]HRW10953.1 GatB/YqeY domain-containing protein [Caldilineaceae bacterium]
MLIVELRNQMSQDLRMAMKNRDKVAVALLRTLMATLDNAEAVAVDHATLPKVPTTERHEVPRKELTSDDVQQLLERELAERQRAHGEYVALGLAAEAERLQTEIELISDYL